MTKLVLISSGQEKNSQKFEKYVTFSKFGPQCETKKSKLIGPKVKPVCKMWTQCETRSVFSLLLMSLEVRNQTDSTKEAVIIYIGGGSGGRPRMYFWIFYQKTLTRFR